MDLAAVALVMKTQQKVIFIYNNNLYNPHNIHPPYILPTRNTEDKGLQEKLTEGHDCNCRALSVETRLFVCTVQLVLLEDND